MLSKRHRRIDKQIREKIDVLERRIMKHENEADINKMAMNRLYEVLEEETNELERDKIQRSIDYYKYSMNYHIRKINKLGDRQEGLEIALKILNK